MRRAGFALAGFVATGVSLATNGRVPFTAEELPTAKEAFVEASTSALAFSNMAFCFSSSLARIGMRSSGMGLLSCQVVSDMAECNQKGTNLERLAELDQIRLALVHLALCQRLLSLSEALLLVGHKVAEASNEAIGGLYSRQFRKAVVERFDAYFRLCWCTSCTGTRSRGQRSSLRRFGHLFSCWLGCSRRDSWARCGLRGRRCRPTRRSILTSARWHICIGAANNRRIPEKS